MGTSYLSRKAVLVAIIAIIAISFLFRIVDGKPLLEDHHVVWAISAVVGTFFVAKTIQAKKNVSASKEKKRQTFLEFLKDIAARIGAMFDVQFVIAIGIVIIVSVARAKIPQHFSADSWFTCVTLVGGIYNIGNALSKDVHR